MTYSMPFKHERLRIQIMPLISAAMIRRGKNAKPLVQLSLISSLFYKTSWSKHGILNPWAWAGTYFGQSIYTSESELSQLHKQDGDNVLLVRFMDRLNEAINRKSALLIYPYDSNYSITSLRKSTHQGSMRYSLSPARKLKNKERKIWQSGFNLWNHE